MGNIEKAKELFDTGSYTCTLINGETVYKSNKKGIAPIMELISSNTDLHGFSAADKVVGKAAAMLFALAGISEVFAEVISAAAERTLANHGIKFTYKTKTEFIINRTGDGFCPMEQAVGNIENLNEAYIVLKEKLILLKAKPQ